MYVSIVCMYVHACVCVYVCMRVCMYVCMYVCMHKWHPCNNFKNNENSCRSCKVLWRDQQEKRELEVALLSMSSTKPTILPFVKMIRQIV